MVQQLVGPQLLARLLLLTLTPQPAPDEPYFVLPYMVLAPHYLPTDYLDCHQSVQDMSHSHTVRYIRLATVSTGESHLESADIMCVQLAVYSQRSGNQNVLIDLR